MSVTGGEWALNTGILPLGGLPRNIVVKFSLTCVKEDFFGFSDRWLLIAA